jgi:hypothetical protein
LDVPASPNTVSNFAASAAVSSVLFRSASSFTVGTVDGVSGVTTAGAGFQIDLIADAIPGTLTVNQPIVSNGSIVVLTADDMAINASVNAGAGGIVLTPFNTTRTTDLGTNSGGEPRPDRCRVGPHDDEHP